MVDVHWRERSGKERGATAILEDISASGACLQFETAVPLGVAIAWNSPKQTFHGYVRYCVYREIGYFVGVEFDPGVKWSQKTFRPGHMLDPQTLVSKK
jgi:hypothetical protein